LSRLSTRSAFHDPLSIRRTIIFSPKSHNLAAARSSSRQLDQRRERSFKSRRTDGEQIAVDFLID